MNDLYNQLYYIYSTKTNDEYKIEATKLAKKILKGVDEDFELNFNESYPNYEDPEFKEKITRKKEFNIFKYNNKDKLENTDKDVCSPKTFTLTDTQRFLRNFISKNTPYNSLLLFHGVGQGKTCTAISIVENLDNYYNKPALIILSSTLLDNFKKQIFDIQKYKDFIKSDNPTKKMNICTGNKYIDMIPDKESLKDDLVEFRINKIINQKYEFMGYKELAIFLDKIRKKIKNTIKDEDKIEKLFIEKVSDLFSNRLIIIDEAHNLRNDSETGSKTIANSFKKLISNVVNVKLVLLTATPMFDNAKEITWILNLLLSNEKKPELKSKDIFDQDGYITDEGTKILIKRTNGIVSYLNYKNPYAFPLRLFPSVNKDNNLIRKFPTKDMRGNDINSIKDMEIIGSKISDIQETLLNQLLNEDEDIQIFSQMQNIVYPNKIIDKSKCLGDKGYKNNFIEDDNNRISYIDKKNQFLMYDNIEKYAPKIKKILDYIINSEGIVFIYSRYYNSGVVPILIALEHIGMSKYNTQNMCKNINIDNKINGNYIVISGNKTLSPNNDKEISVIRSKQNKNGELIKVVIGTKVASEGIDFKNIREIHLMEPWYNLNRVEQIIGRGVRYCSHIDLPIEKRNTTIMFHSITMKNPDIESYDLKTHRMAQYKQIAIDQVENILINNSIDCHFNKLDNQSNIIKINSMQTSQKTVIMEYNHKNKFNVHCNAEEDINNIDTSTFNKNFIINDIDLYKDYIQIIFTNEKILYASYQKLFDLMKKYYKSFDEEIFIYTLDHLVSNKILLNVNKKNYYIIYKSNYYILQNFTDKDIHKTLDEVKKHPHPQYYIPIGKKKIIEKKTMSVNKNIDIVSIIDRLKIQFKQMIITYFYDWVIHNKNYDINIIKTFHRNEGIKKFLLEVYNINTEENDEYFEDRKRYILDVKEILLSFEDVIIDSIIDRLTYDQFIELIRFSLKNNKYINILRRTNIFVFDNDEIKYFYNKQDDTFYKIENNEIKKSNVNEVENKYKEQYDIIGSYIIKNIIDNVSGFINDGIFKVKEKNKTGYVCSTTSYMTLKMLKEKINEIQPNFISMTSNLKNKTNLCYLYELILRKYQSDKFQRPYFMNVAKYKR